MVAADFLQRPDGCRVNTVRNKVLLDGGYACVFMHSGLSVCDMVVISSSVFCGAVKGYQKLLPSPGLLAVRYSLHEGEHGFVICQDFKPVSSQLSLKKV